MVTTESPKLAQVKFKHKLMVQFDDSYKYLNCFIGWLPDPDEFFLCFSLLDGLSQSDTAQVTL